MEDLLSDAIGFKQPPRAHRFKKGQSGNPKGRPRKQVVPVDTSDAAILRRLDREMITVNGEEMTKREVELRMLQAKAMKGDLAAVKLINELRRNAKVDKPPRVGGVLVVPAAPSREEWERRVCANQAKFRSAEYANGSLLENDKSKEEDEEE